MILPKHLRESFKNPMGELIPDADVTKARLLPYFTHKPIIISVGDVTTEKLIGFGINPDLQIIDGKTKRGDYNKLKSTTAREMYITNPAGEITQESIDNIVEAFMMEETTRLIVDGEEDLLAVPCILHAPSNSILLYGQPNEGMVLVTIGTLEREKAKWILENME